EATVLRLCDLLAVAVEDLRQGGDPRLPLELALVKVTRPGADLTQESLAFRIEQLERRLEAGGAPPAAPDPPRAAPAPAAAPPLELRRLQDAWERSVVPAVENRKIPLASVLAEAR